MRILSTKTLSLLLLVLVSSNAIAQIEEIVVTAQKRPENIQDVPISISAFSGAFLEDSGIDTLQDLGPYTPNLYLSQSSQVANQRIIIRGVGSVGDSAIEPSVAVFIDGVYTRGRHPWSGQCRIWKLLKFYVVPREHCSVAMPPWVP